ncbi:MAG: hypothetical protein OEY11_10760 [Gammaproteobacteria bacterium]|nr:hypothetical protein [Gammaproteobacteria bacterium]
MKFYSLLTVLTFTFAVNTVYASENMKSDDEVSSYCAEQASSEGIVDESERAGFIQDCIESYTVSTPVTEEPVQQIN